jgi:DNA-binding XRE family transcriptional regulator
VCPAFKASVYLYNSPNLARDILYVNQKLNGDKKMLASQCRMARAALGLTVRELAKRADVSHDTIIRLEGGQELKKSTVGKVKGAFEAAGIEFTNGGEPGVKLKRPSEQR